MFRANPLVAGVVGLVGMAGVIGVFELLPLIVPVKLAVPFESSVAWLPAITSPFMLTLSM